MNILTIIDEYVKLGKMRRRIEASGRVLDDEEKTAYENILYNMDNCIGTYKRTCAAASIEVIKAAEMRSQAIVREMLQKQEHLSGRQQWAKTQADAAIERGITISARSYKTIADDCQKGLADIDDELPMREFFSRELTSILQTKMDEQDNHKVSML